MKDLLNVLADAGLVERQGIEGGRPGAFVLALTPDGRRVARGETRPELALPTAAGSSGPVGGVPPGGPAAWLERTAGSPKGRRRSPTRRMPTPALLARLKSWRTEEARRKGMPPYVIFHDRTLLALAAARPRDRDQLRRVKGIGPAKLDAYAETLLGLLARRA